MAHKRQRGNVWEYTFKRTGVLDKPIYMTFKSEAEGDAYGKRLEALLDRGIVPVEHQSTKLCMTIGELIGKYLSESTVKDKDRLVLRALDKAIGQHQTLIITPSWVDAWIESMKRENPLAPATIRARVGALARCTDWGMRKSLLVMPDHPLRSLPIGYSQYSTTDAAFSKGGREDVERDRRLEDGEFERIMAVIECGVLPRTHRPYAIPHAKDFALLVTLAVESAMRLREMYTLSTDQVNLSKKTVFLDKTKNGSKRQVPLSSVALAALRVKLAGFTEDRVFPWWDGDDRSLVATSDFLSKLFRSVAEAAGCHDLKFHDLRHHAVCCLYEKTTMTDLQISKITGHRSLTMLRRYSNLRGSDLAEKMW